jgi:hypothetical protein
MRPLLVLALVACDQGRAATPPPAPMTREAAVAAPVAAVAPALPSEVRNDDDFIRRASVVIDDLIVAMTPPNGDCERAASQLVTYIGGSRLELAALTRYSDTHKPISDRLGKEFEPKLEKLLPQLTKCTSNRAFMKAIEGLSDLDKWHGLVRNDAMR